MIQKQETARAKQKQLKGASDEAKQLKTELADLTQARTEAEEKLCEFLINEPNILLDIVPAGIDEKDNKKIFETKHEKKIGIPHYDLIDKLTLQEEAANLSGSRFVVLGNALSKLKNALVNWMLEENEKQGYQEYTAPSLVNESALFGTSQLPKFAQDAFQTTDGKWLASTAEVALVNLFGGKILEDGETKLCMSFSPCFRSEAGSAGRDTKGLVRLHQFHKLELVTICKAEDAEKYHEKQLETAKNLLNKLGLHYQVLLLCGADSGFSAAKQYDIEVWMPGLQRYLEIASCSQCGTFQAVRANIRYKSDGKLEYMHTLNGSALPIERLLAAIIENYYEDGKVQIPAILKPYIKADYISTIDGKLY